ncbi:MAG: anti-sigma factor [Salinarimonas sp.]|nr:anti-sigma factor [Salinarimonas sp.]
MTAQDQNGPERDGDDMLAAEYVLGVLPASERQEVARRIESDAAFARLVEAWEATLTPLADSYEEVSPPVDLKQKIDTRLFGDAGAKAGSATTRLLDRLWLWRGLAAASLAVAIMFGALLFTQPEPEPPAPRLLASLSHEETGVSVFAIYDAATGQVVLAEVAGERPTDSEFELWVIEGERAPVSLGLIDGDTDIRIDLAEDVGALMQAGSVLAVSVEPPGGSPTGQPTGPVVALGELRAI